MKGFESVIDFFSLTELIESFSKENEIDKNTIQKIMSTINDSLQYHSFLLGGYSGFPNVFTENYLLLLSEYIMKENTQAVIKGQLCYTAYLYPQSNESKAFCMDLYGRGTAENFIIITEGIIQVSPNNVFQFEEKKRVAKKPFLCYITEVSFEKKNGIPAIIPLGKTKLENLLENIKRSVQDSVRKCSQQCGWNKVEIYMLGINVDQFFYVHTPPKEINRCISIIYLKGGIVKLINMSLQNLIAKELWGIILLQDCQILNTRWNLMWNRTYSLQ